MRDSDAQHIKADIAHFEENVAGLIEKLQECRKENELLRSELSSLQNVLRSCKLPGSLGSALQEPEALSGMVPYAEKMQVKQKLVMLLQKIEMEFRNNQAL
ncbi:MAG: hypothetical protein HGA62_03070 [Chlorobiaceae bacterium]|nr:hypothetical protein [Chlorobiaceae bacterium]NTV61805.1 hypothetical protein [Chlorobiaceae bacterium]